LSASLINLDINHFAKIDDSPLGTSLRASLWRAESKIRVPNVLELHQKVIIKFYRQEVGNFNCALMRNHLKSIFASVSQANNYLASRVVLPIALVEKGGEFVGFAMNEVIEGSTFPLIFDNGSSKEQISELKFFLNRFIEQRKMGVPELGGERLLALIEDFLRSLALLHQNNVVVGDISPSNLIVSQKKNARNQDRILFLDFDSFRQAGTPHPMAPEGTPLWWAPEQEKNRKLQNTKESDVFKACLLIRRLLHHTIPSPVDSFSLYQSVIAERFLKNNGGQVLSQLINLGLSNNPRQRPRIQQLNYEFSLFRRNCIKSPKSSESI
jgi:serine/threonine protein kinase